MNKKVYIGMAADLIHPGHINVIKKGSELGDVIVGLLSDEAIASYKRIPYMKFEDRKKVIESIAYVKEVVRQDTLDYTTNILKYKPEYVLHGDDWKKGVQSEVRKKVIETLSSYGGELIEIPYTVGISSTAIQKDIKRNGITPENRRKSLSDLLEVNQCCHQKYINCDFLLCRRRIESSCSVK